VKTSSDISLIRGIQSEDSLSDFLICFDFGVPSFLSLQLISFHSSIRCKYNPNIFADARINPLGLTFSFLNDMKSLNISRTAFDFFHAWHDAIKSDRIGLGYRRTHVNDFVYFRLETVFVCYVTFCLLLFSIYLFIR
jgi:hypothetical protein